jgi:hypothetical protein
LGYAWQRGVGRFELLSHFWEGCQVAGAWQLV